MRQRSLLVAAFLFLRSSALPEAPPPFLESRLSERDYAEHVERLSAKLPHRGFHVLIEPPFVVIGDESPEVVRQRAATTIRWAVAQLKRKYFQKDPEHIIDIWLFGDKDSYRRNTRRLFGAEPSTPFGYYSSRHRALVMDISTGGGTLVHEIVHPFIEANFPACPPWFNEGLASLYEQSARHPRTGHIRGLTNWRLAGLQKAIERSQLPGFDVLTAASAREFYEEDPGTNYAQARYLCYYLEEKGLLETYYRRFVTGHEGDPTGYETLKVCLAADDMAAFQKEWEAFVLKLRYP